MTPLKILLTGKNGQVGYELARSLQGLGQVIALDRSQMDLANLDQVRSVIRSVQPDLIVNPAAYTAVDKAESEPALAFCVNGEAPGLMAQEAARLGAVMMHFSTDYVFDGSKNGPYTETDATGPISVYGSSKLAGEQAIIDSGAAHVILRTSWVYGMRGKNFLLTMLRLSEERDALRVVADQVGAPTWCRTLADTTAHIVAQAHSIRSAHAGGSTAAYSDWWRQRSGIYHLTCQGQTSWHGFTQAILQQAGRSGKCQLTPIPAAEYPTPARRPANSVLSCAKLIETFCDLPDWQTALTLCMER
jgi:dTDP-4-dehydrorhamnose reductase